MVLSGSVNPDGNSVQINAGIDRVQNEFRWSGGSCVDLDLLIKKVSDKIVSERIQPSPYNYGLRGINVNVELYIRALGKQKSMLEGLFIGNRCADKIETLRQKESAVLITKQAIEQEKAVLKPSNTEQRIYIVGGALVLMVGLLILAKK
jgi:hypothetical protein